MTRMTRTVCVIGVIRGQKLRRRTRPGLWSGFLPGGFRVGNASSTEGVLQSIISLVAGVLPERSGDFRHRHFSRPRLGPHPRVLHRELVKNRLVVDACEAFNHVQVLGSRERSLVCEIGGVDDERITLPMANRVAHPLVNVLGKMRSVQANDAGIVDLLGFNNHVSRTLYDLQIAVVAGGEQRRSDVVSSDTARAQRPVLGAVELMSLFLSRSLSKSLSGVRRQRRNGSLRSYNQRGSPVPGNLGL